MIERKGQWIITNALFREEGKEKFEELGIDGYDVLEPSPFRFRLDRLQNYNEGNHGRPTTIMLFSGDSYSLDTPFKEFDEFILKQEIKDGNI